jgi:hypothetical protein
VSTEIVPAAGITIAPDLLPLVEKCRQIRDSLRISVVQHYWRLGEAISNAAPRENRQVWGARVIITLERELDIDRTNLKRAVQCYETFSLGDLGARVHLTWGKLLLLLPISADLRADLLERIESGELRTTDDVRDAIREFQQALGRRPAPLLRPGQMELFGVPGLTLERFSRGWSKAPPMQRSAATRAIIIPNMGLQDLDRPAALHELSLLRSAIDAYESSLDGAADAD